MNCRNSSRTWKTLFLSALFLLVGASSWAQDPCTVITASAACGSPNSTAITAGAGFWPAQTICSFNRLGKERVYSYTPPTTGGYTITINSNSINGFHCVSYVATTCGQAGPWTCISDLSSGQTGLLAGTMSLTAGTTYYILWRIESTTAAGTVNWTINCAGDPCSAATPAATCGTANSTAITAGTGVWAGQSLCGFSRLGKERVYSYVAPTTGNYTITINSNTINGFHCVSYKASPCSEAGPWTCISDLAASQTGLLGTTMSLTAGTTYYILWRIENTTAAGTVNWTIGCPGAVNPCTATTAAAACGSPNSTLIPAGTGAWPAQSLCGFSRSGVEKMYTYTAPTSGSYSVTINTNGVNGFHCLSYKASPCAQAGPWTCVSDLSAFQTGTLATPMSLTAGTTYYLLWKTDGTTTTGTVNWTINCVPLVDPCSIAVAAAECASPNNTVMPAGTANWPGQVLCGVSRNGTESMYTYTPPVTGPYTVTINSNTINSWHALAYTAAPCGQAGPWTCVSDLGAGTTGTLGTILPLTAGTTYYLLWKLETPTVSGTVNWTIDCAPPPFDPCEAPIPLAACGSTQVSNHFGTGAPWDLATCDDFTVTAGQEQVYTYTPPWNGNYSLSVTAISGGWADFYYKPISAGCGPDDWNCIGLTSFVPYTSPTVQLTGGIAYYIMVDAEQSGATSVTFMLDCAPPPCALTSSTPGTVNNHGCATFFDVSVQIDPNFSPVDLEVVVNGGAPTTIANIPTGTPFTLSSVGGATYQFAYGDIVQVTAIDNAAGCDLDLGTFYGNCPVDLVCGETITVAHCYQNGDSRTFTYNAEPGETVTITFISGTMDAGDVLQTYDGSSIGDPGLAGLTGNFPNLSGASATSTGESIHMVIVDDGNGGSCQDGDQTSWLFEVECTPACTDADAAVTDISTCATYSFVVDVDILDFGTSAGGSPQSEVSVSYSVNGGGPTTVGPFNSTGPISPQLGPFTIGDDVNVVLLHASDEDCDRNMGNFNGDESCPVPGETCASPMVIPVNAIGACPANAVVGDNDDSTQDGPTPTCDTFGGPWPDVWYRFNAGTNTLVNVDMTNIDMGDIVVDVFTGTCGALIPVSGACGIGAFDLMPMSVTPGANYWVRVSSNVNFGGTGQHSICVSQPAAAPANDLCGNGQSLTVGPLGSCPAGAVPGTTTSASSDGAPLPSCIFGTTVDVFYTFNSGANTGVVYNLTLGTMTGSGVQLLSACGGTELACFTNQLSGTLSVTPGTNYVLRILSPTASTGTFNICLSAAPPPPANDGCANAAPLTVQVFGDCMAAATTGTTENATADGPTPSCDPLFGNVWYSFNSGPNTTVLSSLAQGAVGAATDLAIDYISDACPGSATFSCGYGPPFSLSYDNVPIPVTPFTTYRLRIWSNTGFGDPGTFSLCLQSPPAPACNAGYTEPANGSSTCSDGSTALLSWPAVPNAGAYDVYFDNAAGTTLVSANQAATSYTTAPLGAGTYSWRVVPKNGSGTAAGPCLTWTFTRTPPPLWYQDTDADGFGNALVFLAQCSQPAGYVTDHSDNCPFNLNPGQEDGDGDDVGNACDNCLSVANTDQANADGDALGNACDACPNDAQNDIDGDGVCGDVDNCPTVFGQIGNVCDANPGPGYTLGEINASCTCVAVSCTQNLTIEIQTDANPNQITWELREQGTNNLIQSGTPTPPNGIQTMNTCVPNGCYYLKVIDSGGDGITGGGYILRTAGSPGMRIIDNRRNFTNLPGGPPDVSQIAGGEGFCVPIGTTTAPIYTSCDKLDWVSGEYIVCSAAPAVSALWNAGNTPAEATTGYEFQFFNPNGGYIFNRFRSHAVSDGFAPDNSTRACHMKINNWAAANQIHDNVLMNVRIRTRINGVNGSWGAACRFKIDPVRAACPLTKLTDIPGEQYYSCGTTRAWGSGNYVYARPVSGATQYQWRFRIDGESFLSLRTTTTYFIQLNWITLPLQNGKTYDVEVRAFKNGAWCIDAPTPANCGFVSPCFMQWGDVCLLTIDNTPMNGGENFAAEGSSALRMYPNPNRGDQLYLSLDAVEEGVQTVSVDIVDLFGKRVSARTIPVTDGFVSTVLDLEGTMANGMYMVNIAAGEQRYTERLVIQR